MILFWSKRRYFAFIFLLVFLALVFPCQIVLGADETSLLKEGMSGSRVLQLQKDLKSLGFFKPTPTGYFGSTTKTSVISFQKKYKIPTTGAVGPLTFAQLNKLLKRSSASSPAKIGSKIVIDAGHGGIDPGTSKSGVIEKEVNLDIAKKLESYLEDNNHDIVMTRTKDTSLYKLSKTKGSTQIKDLDARVNIINKSKASLFVSIHVNSLPKDPGMSGSIVFYNSNNPKSRTLALSIQKELNNMTVNGKQRNRNNIQKANFYVLKNSNIPGVLVETAFITNSTERKLLSQKSFREKIAKAIMNGIENSGLLK